MPSLIAHQQAADEFLAAYERMDDQSPIVLGLFLYLSSLHLVEAVAALTGEHFTGHTYRRRFLLENHRKIAKEYAVLEDVGRKARYDCDQFDWPFEHLRHPGSVKRRYDTMRRWAEQVVKDAGENWSPPSE